MRLAQRLACLGEAARTLLLRPGAELRGQVARERRTQQGSRPRVGAESLVTGGGADAVNGCLALLVVGLEQARNVLLARRGARQLGERFVGPSVICERLRVG